MQKKTILLVGIGIISLFMPNISVEANENINGEEAEIRPYYVNVRSITCSLDISDGVATCKGSMSIQNATTGTITIELQQKKDNSWIKIKSWTDSGSSLCSVTKKCEVSKGSYRLKLSYKCGADSGTKYSMIKSY